MNTADTLIRFINLASEIYAQVWDESEESLIQFEKSHVFLPQIQPYLTADALGLILPNMHSGNLYEIRDLLGIRLIVFQYEKKSVLVGPYVDEPWDEARAEQLLSSFKLPISQLLPYKMYYCGHRMVDEPTILRIISGAIAALNPSIPPFYRQTISGLSGTAAPDIYEDEIPEFDLIAKRYEQENLFLQLLYEGHPHSALKAYKMLDSISSGETQYKYYDGNLQTAMANTTIIRTLCRKTAEKAGVHAAVVDSISTDYAQKTYSSKNLTELGKLIYEMVIDFGKAIQDAKALNYSVPVNTVITYIDLNINQDISLEKLAQTAGLSKQHLCRLFKKETSQTISQYIAHKRCDKAADLLRNTNLPIQDISAYIGYLDNNYFVKVFKKYYTLAPSDYRKAAHPIV